MFPASHRLIVGARARAGYLCEGLSGLWCHHHHHRLYAVALWTGLGLLVSHSHPPTTHWHTVSFSGSLRAHSPSQTDARALGTDADLFLWFTSTSTSSLACIESTTWFWTPIFFLPPPHHHHDSSTVILIPRLATFASRDRAFWHAGSGRPFPPRGSTCSELHRFQLFQIQLQSQFHSSPSFLIFALQTHRSHNTTTPITTHPPRITPTYSPRLPPLVLGAGHLDHPASSSQPHHWSG